MLCIIIIIICYIAIYGNIDIIMIETDTGWESLTKFFGCFDAHAPSEL